MLIPIPALEDSGLLSAALAGTRSAAGQASTDRRLEFENILAQALPRFRRIAMRWLRNREDAEDAVQDAMLSAFRHIERFDRRSQMMTWLTAIVINAVRMQIRRRPPGRMLQLDEAPKEGMPAISGMLADSRPTPEQNLEQRELLEIVNKLSGSLKSAQRTALQLRVRGDLSIQETADTLGVPEGTVKAQLARGRAALRKRFRKVTATGKTGTRSASLTATRKASSAGFRSGPAQHIGNLPSAVFSQPGREVWASA